MVTRESTRGTGVGIPEHNNTEGIVSALHVLGHASRVSGDSDAARRAHRRALGLASRIGHVAAMCEAVEDLARDEGIERPALAAMLLNSARAERGHRGLPLRERDARELADLERILTAGTEPEPPVQEFSDLVMAMAQ
jgi:hypothetical protein